MPAFGEECRLSEHSCRGVRTDAPVAGQIFRACPAKVDTVLRFGHATKQGFRAKDLSQSNPERL
ncbi:MAG: hypothetical protein CMJ15_14765 [Pelagibacterium sp.]|nr:hypothetical protein [Pelagibacterium sp.]